MLATGSSPLGLFSVAELGATVYFTHVANVGTWRRETVCARDHVMRIPDRETLSVEAAATLLVNPPTAFRLLTDFVALRPGDVVVQNGANSAVGRLVVQMAAAMGLRTVNIVRDRADFDGLASELASLAPSNQTLILRAETLKEDAHEQIRAQFDGALPRLGLNCVGGAAVSDMARLMAPRDAVIVSYGGMSKRPISLSVAPFIFHNLTLRGFWMSSWYDAHGPASPERAAMFRQILVWYREGRLQQPKCKLFRLETEWRAALAEATAPFHQHKCLFVMD